MGLLDKNEFLKFIASVKTVKHMKGGRMREYSHFLLRHKTNLLLNFQLTHNPLFIHSYIETLYRKKQTTESQKIIFSDINVTSQNINYINWNSNLATNDAVLKIINDRFEFVARVAFNKLYSTNNNGYTFYNIKARKYETVEINFKDSIETLYQSGEITDELYTETMKSIDSGCIWLDKLSLHDQNIITTELGKKSFILDNFTNYEAQLVSDFLNSIVTIK